MISLQFAVYHCSEDLTMALFSQPQYVRKKQWEVERNWAEPGERETKETWCRNSTHHQNKAVFVFSALLIHKMIGPSEFSCDSCLVCQVSSFCGEDIENSAFSFSAARQPMGVFQCMRLKRRICYLFTTRRWRKSTTTLYCSTLVKVIGCELVFTLGLTL